MGQTATDIKFKAKLHKPAGKDVSEDWLFLRLPKEASDQLPSRSMVSVEGTLNQTDILTTLLPDGEGGHWMKVDSKLQNSANVKQGEPVELSIAPALVEPEPEVPDDVRAALESAGKKAMETWQDITPRARRDYISWVGSGRKAETRTKRIEVMCSKLAAGNRRPCCFDRSGMYDKSMSCPLADED